MAECPALDWASPLSFKGRNVADPSVREQQTIKDMWVVNFEKEEGTREGIVGRRRERSVKVEVMACSLSV